MRFISAKEWRGKLKRDPRSKTWRKKREAIASADRTTRQMHDAWREIPACARRTPRQRIELPLF